LGLFAGLTFVAFTSKKDFSFLGGVLKIGSFVAIGLIVASLLMGFNLGIWFSGAMVLIAGISILYQTSNIIHNYRPEQHVAASLGLFASVALLFWYVLQILLSLSSND
jgi:FtsH-binding integral membrane protein